MIEAQDIERRCTALEVAQNETTQTLKWVVARMGRMSAVLDEHTLRLDRIESRLGNVETRLGSVETRLGNVETRLGNVENGLNSLRRDLPTMIADVMREVLKEHKA